MSKELYYTPELEEFHVGFEFEFRGCPTLEKEWKKRKYSPYPKDNPDSFYYALTLMDSEYFRVKYLDKQDIEECGFNEISTNKYLKPYKNMFHHIFIDVTEFRKVKIIYHPFMRSGHTLFYGEIKNKSELKKLLKQLGINE